MYGPLSTNGLQGSMKPLASPLVLMSRPPDVGSIQITRCTTNCWGSPGGWKTMMSPVWRVTLGCRSVITTPPTGSCGRMLPERIGRTCQVPENTATPRPATAKASTITGTFSATHRQPARGRRFRTWRRCGRAACAATPNLSITVQIGLSLRRRRQRGHALAGAHVPLDRTERDRGHDGLAFVGVVEAAGEAVDEDQRATGLEVAAAAGPGNALRLPHRKDEAVDVPCDVVTQRRRVEPAAPGADSDGVDRQRQRPGVGDGQGVR